MATKKTTTPVKRRRAPPKLAVVASKSDVAGTIPSSYDDGVKAVEAATMPPRACPSIMLIFNFVRSDGTTGTSRFFFDGAYDVRTKADIAALETALMKHAEGQYASVMITGWKPLEG